MDESVEAEVKRKHKKDRAFAYPRTFKDAERVLLEVRTKNHGLRNAVYSSKFKGPVLKKVYGLTQSVLKSLPSINFILESLNLLIKEPALTMERAQILIHELVKEHKLPEKNKFVLIVSKYLPDIRRLLLEYEEREPEQSVSDVVSIPKYARVQTLVCSVDGAMRSLQDAGFVKKDLPAGISPEKYKQEVMKLKSREFLPDIDFKEVLVFRSGENLVECGTFNEGRIFIQDKASYIPSHVLNPPTDSVVLDCCAAPGMKTAHLACIMKNSGRILALERDDTRLSILNKTLVFGNIQNCTTTCVDFTTVNPKAEPYNTVEYISLDPSCSGSGMAERQLVDRVFKNDSKNQERIEKLSAFQLIMLKHALSFPRVKKVAYSTCSVYEEENEAVVVEALKHYSGAFKVVEILPNWPTRGLDKYSFGKLCVRASPQENLTNGFFVALIERVHFPKQNSKKRQRNKNTATGEKSKMKTKESGTKRVKVEKDNKKSNRAEKGSKKAESGKRQKEQKKTKKIKNKVSN